MLLLDKFLEITFASQVTQTAEYDNTLWELINAFRDKLDKYLSSDIAADLQEEFTDALCQMAEYSGVEGMKLAIGILDGSYPVTL